MALFASRERGARTGSGTGHGPAKRRATGDGRRGRASRQRLAQSRPARTKVGLMCVGMERQSGSASASAIRDPSAERRYMSRAATGTGACQRPNKRRQEAAPLWCRMASSMFHGHSAHAPRRQDGGGSVQWIVPGQVCHTGLTAGSPAWTFTSASRAAQDRHAQPHSRTLSTEQIGNFALSSIDQRVRDGLARRAGRRTSAGQGRAGPSREAQRAGFLSGRAPATVGSQTRREGRCR